MTKIDKTDLHYDGKALKRLSGDGFPELFLISLLQSEKAFSKM